MNTTVSAGSAAGGSSLAIVTIIVYLLSLKGIQIPDGVAVAINALLTTAFHCMIAVRCLPVSAGELPILTQQDSRGLP